MNIGVLYADGQVAPTFAEAQAVLVVSCEGQNPTGKHLMPCAGAEITKLLKLLSTEKIAVLICGGLGLAARNTLEMIGILLVPGCEGSAEEAVAKFLIGEKQGDPTMLEIAREEDPDDPMACMHDCAKCAGCGPIEILKNLPEE